MASHSVDDLLRSLPDLVARDATLALARDAAGRTAEVEVAPGDGLLLRLRAPLDAHRVVAGLGIEGTIYIVSGDVHQRSWQLKIGSDAGAAGPGRQRIAAAPPKLGDWQVDVRVEGRPAGPSPGIVAGASPAYPLAGREAKVTSIGLWT